jgi:tagatose-1,6-bisphosphate aldolase
VEHFVSRTPSAAALRPIATSEGLYTILAIDHGRSLQRHLDLADGAEAHRRLLATKQAVVGLLAEYCSAVLLDAGVAASLGQGWQLPDHVGLIVGLDAPDYDDTVCPPPAMPPDNVFDDAIRAGAGVAKIVLYYDPELPDAGSRRQAVTLIAEKCAVRGLPLLVEPLPHPGAVARPQQRPWPIEAVIEHVVAAGAALLKLPLWPLAPDRADLCARITAAASGVPWILLSSGAPYGQFMDNLQTALMGGASGFAAGRSLWGELVLDVRNEAAARAAVERLAGAVRLTQSQGGAKIR